jgi:aspartyl protease family protein
MNIRFRQYLASHVQRLLISAISILAVFVSAHTFAQTTSTNVAPGPKAPGPSVTLVGVFPGKALLVIDKSNPKAVAIGESLNSVKLLEVDDSSALVLLSGKKIRLNMGQPHSSSGASSDGGGGDRVVLPADERGHFHADGKINGQFARMMVDTGATSVALSIRDAQRLGIDYRKGKPMRVQTAGGTQSGYSVLLDSVTVGEITLYQVDAMIVGEGLPIILLGMSFLNRTNMVREGQTMTIVRRF